MKSIKWKCTSCNVISFGDDGIDKVEDPRPLTGMEGHYFCVCTNCRTADQFERVCDVEYCNNKASEVSVSESRGIAHTCYQHRNRR